MPMLSSPIQLIVGLGNPGERYQDTRHNAGAWFAELLANNSLRKEKKFHGEANQLTLESYTYHVLIPDTFMNHSGQSVQAFTTYYKVAAENILIAHDELDLPIGTVKLKYGGGHGGHNGLRDIIGHLGTPNFWRLRIGIGHPGHSSQVSDYVLARISAKEKQQIIESMYPALHKLPDLLSGNLEKAMKELHTK